MISINLLPQEFRRRDRISSRTLGATVLGVLTVCSTAGFLGYQWFGVYKVRQDERIRLEETLKSLQTSAIYQEQLVREVREYEKRTQTIQDISQSRVLWTRKLDQFIDVVNNEGDTERHMVWFKNLDVKAGTGEGGPIMSLNGVSQSKEFARVANFLDDVQNHELFLNFAAISQPQGRVAYDDKKFPPETIEFPLDLTMKPPREWVRAPIAATPAGGR